MSTFLLRCAVPLLVLSTGTSLFACAPSTPPATPMPMSQVPTTATPAGGPLLVAAAADLQFAFTDIANLYRQQTGQKVTVTFGSTGELAQQIENGAPFDLFASADISYIEGLKAKGLIIPETQQLYAQGRIVLAVNKQSGVQATRLADLTQAAITRVAIANPQHAPYGRAAMQALQASGVWDAIQPKLVYGETVPQALQFVQTGNAPVGIVSLSVANVPEITYTLIDSQLHQPLNQALAVLSRSPRVSMAKDFIDFVNGPQGRPIMKKYGFLLPGEFQ